MVVDVQSADREVSMRTQTLTIAALSVATVLLAESLASAQTYEWVRNRRGDCAANDMGAPTCNMTGPARPDADFCNSTTVNRVAVCWDETPSFPLPGGCNIPACTYKSNRFRKLQGDITRLEWNCVCLH
jgi:hypothetical protein